VSKEDEEKEIKIKIKMKYAHTNARTHHNEQNTHTHTRTHTLHEPHSTIDTIITEFMTANLALRVSSVVVRTMNTLVVKYSVCVAKSVDSMAQCGSDCNLQRPCLCGRVAQCVARHATQNTDLQQTEQPPRTTLEMW
jgi:hypothetical protein